MDKDCDCVICKYYRGEVSKDFMLGYFEGKKEDAWIKLELAEDRQKWHDLRENPNDLPKENKEYLVAYKNFLNQEKTVLEICNWQICKFVDKEYKDIPWFECEDVLIAWCEIPKFEEED